MGTLYIRGQSSPEIAELRKKLKHELGDDAADYVDLVCAGTPGQTFNETTEAAVRRWQSGIGLIADGVVGPYALELLGLRKPGTMDLDLSLENVRQLFPATKPANIERYLPYVVAALDAAGLHDRTIICAALGTIRAETEGFLPISEMPSQYNTTPGKTPFSAYEMRAVLGNTKEGDGPRFKGRGFVQLTGRDNYTRFGQALGIDLTTQPDLANAPEIAATLLASYLAAKQTAMREAVAAGNFKKARQLVNGGGHGLDRFRAVFSIADTIWPPTPSAQTAGRGRGKSVADASSISSLHKTANTRPHTLTARKDPIDLRDRPYQPPPVSLQDTFPTDNEIRSYLPAYTDAKLILDQGSEGACTGFGLACVVNFLRWRKAATPRRMKSVSPRMLYHFARRFDEYAGEDYDGSSCRGALKGWFKNGVCLEEDWPYGPKHGQPHYGYAERATQCTLGVYYRLELNSITDVQAAIQEVGAVYVSAFTHDGWDTLPKTKRSASKRSVGANSKSTARRGALPNGHADIPVIDFSGRPSRDGGHAFALIGFNIQGFIVQNSWGSSWGLGGFAILTYADWLANAMDAWVVAMGVPGVVAGRVGSAPSRGRSAAGTSALRDGWWSKDQAYRHSVVLGNDGRVKSYLTEDAFSRTLLQQVAVLPDTWFRKRPQNEPKRLVIYAHGGLNSEDDAIDRARAMGRHFMGNGCYPLFMIWKTGLLESIGNIFEDARRRDPARAGGRFSEWFTEQSDLLIEKTIGRHAARPIWAEMKENAGLGFASGRGGDLMINALKKLVETWGDKLQIHLIGHSAGSILLGHFLSTASRRGLNVDRVTSVSLFAPACTVQFANENYASQPTVMARLHLDLLSDRVERNDNVVMIYRKSLLYMVANALEVDLRTPLMGMANALDPDFKGWDGTSSVSATLGQWRTALKQARLEVGKGIKLLDADKVTNAIGNTGTPPAQINAAHGSFDNDVEVLSATLKRILGGSLQQEVDDLRGF